MVPYAEAGPLYGMVWPMRISVSDAPGSYFFSALAEVASNAMAATTALCTVDISASTNGAQQPRDTGRKKVDEDDDGNAIHRPGCSLRDAACRRRNVMDEERPDDRPGDRAEAADDDPHQEPEREEDGESIGGDELQDDGAQRPGDAGVHGADAEGRRLVEGG